MREPTEEELEDQVDETIRDVERANIEVSDAGWSWFLLEARVTAYRLLSHLEEELKTP